MVKEKKKLTLENGDCDDDDPVIDPVTITTDKEKSGIDKRKDQTETEKSSPTKTHAHTTQKHFHMSFVRIHCIFGNARLLPNHMKFKGTHNTQNSTQTINDKAEIKT